ncbi:zinc ribbon domain-containing protein [Psychrosphaera sp. B3R10]|nr:zinc ribbon domain-containing protein [Psychrosphaera sp. I2R16]MBU2987768.1 zinc ribbon domain-containing protein [Psychrosphaera sp. B3R10]
MSIRKKIQSSIDNLIMKNGPHRYEINEHRIKCNQCQNEFFDKGEAQLNTAGMSFIGLDWANKTATTLACRNCGFIMWFVKTLTKVPNR